VVFLYKLIYAFPEVQSFCSNTALILFKLTRLLLFICAIFCVERKRKKERQRREGEKERTKEEKERMRKRREGEKERIKKEREKGRKKERSKER
jgi:hypothetical protein